MTKCNVHDISAFSTTHWKIHSIQYKSSVSTLSIATFRRIIGCKIYI